MPTRPTCGDAESVEALHQRIADEVGVPDVVINNAGGQFPGQAIDFSPNGWNAVVQNNLNGSWFMMQRAARGWRDAGRGAYRGRTQRCHRRLDDRGRGWAPLGIRVNCVAPGLTATEGLAVYPPEAQKEFPRANAMKRPGTPMEIAEACIHLAASSSSFITGEVLTVDGGGRLWGEL